MMLFIERQLGFGPRFLGAPGHEQVKDYLISELTSFADENKTQKWEYSASDGSKKAVTNIFASFYPEKKERIIIATHYDSREFADRDLENPKMAVPGANDSTSGTAVLLAIGSYLKKSREEPRVGVDLIFFDGEDDKDNYINMDWKPLGSTYFAEHISEIYKEKPEGGLIVDMVCDKDLKIMKEIASFRDASIESEKFWKVAQASYPEFFSSSFGLEILDDHTPLNKIGIPTFLIIDFEYPYWHTTEDTIDKCSAESLEAVANSVLNYIYSL